MIKFKLIKFAIIFMIIISCREKVNNNLDSYIIKEWNVYKYKGSSINDHNEFIKIKTVFDTLIFKNNVYIPNSKNLITGYLYMYDTLLKKHWKNENVTPKKFKDTIFKNIISLIPNYDWFFTNDDSIFRFVNFWDYRPGFNNIGSFDFDYNPRLGLINARYLKDENNPDMYKLQKISYYCNGKLMYNKVLTNIPILCDSCKYHFFESKYYN